jgi:alpha-glucoside transport system substrate-binding protein
MDFIGAFAQGFIEDLVPDAVAGEDYDFFDFVTIDPMYEGSETGAADVAVMFNDTPEAESFMQYMAEGQNWESWAAAGGYASPSQALDTSVYPDEIATKAAEQLTGSEIFRFDADDLMPSEVQAAYWNGIIDYLQNPDDLDTILQDIEDVAATADYDM